MENPITTTLRLINKTSDFDGLSCVIMQKNIASDFESGIAWRVVSNLAHGETYAFDYEDVIQVSAVDTYGNYTPKIEAKQGTMFKLIRGETGVSLSQINSNLDPTGIAMLNALDEGSTSFWCYRSGTKIAGKFNLPPGVLTRFEFKPELVIGVVSHGDVREGEEINPILIANFTTQLPIEGLAFADIVMTGGGSGENSTPITFKIENAVPQAN